MTRPWPQPMAITRLTTLATAWWQPAAIAVLGSAGNVWAQPRAVAAEPTAATGPPPLSPSSRGRAGRLGQCRPASY